MTCGCSSPYQCWMLGAIGMSPSGLEEARRRCLRSGDQVQTLSIVRWARVIVDRQDDQRAIGQQCAALLLVLLAGGSNIVRDLLLLVIR